MTVKLLIVDDHAVVRSGLRYLFAQSADRTIVGEADDGKTALTLVGQFQPDIVIMDISMPQLNGIESTRRIVAEFHHVKVIVFSIHNNWNFVSEAFKAGASAYLLKDNAIEELNQAIDQVQVGKSFISPALSNTVLRNYPKIQVTQSEHNSSTLSPRESEILQLLSEGHSSKEIAFQLSLSSKTVDTHRQHIMKKLSLTNLADMTRYAIRAGLSPL